MEDSKKIDTASLEVIRKLLTTNARKERYCDGHLAAMFKNGHIVALLRRREVIPEKLGN